MYRNSEPYDRGMILCSCCPERYARMRARENPQPHYRAVQASDLDHLELGHKYTEYTASTCGMLKGRSIHDAAYKPVVHVDVH